MSWPARRALWRLGALGGAGQMRVWADPKDGVELERGVLEDVEEERLYPAAVVGRHAGEALRTRRGGVTMRWRRTGKQS